MTFLRQTWYAASWAADVETGSPVKRTIINEPLLIWRDDAGAVSIMHDLCPHRFVPLSMGKQEEGGIRCGYHGIKFGSDGQCVENPHGPILKSLCVKSYPVAEKHMMVWVWMGDPAAADPALIPDLAYLDTTPVTAKSMGYLHIEASHKLMEDNLLDPTHADYLHPDTLGGGSNTRAKMTIDEHETSLFASWIAKSEPVLPVFRGMLPNPDTQVDQWTTVHWHPNGVCSLRAGLTLAGAPESEGYDTFNAHILTPETEFTSHYFFGNTRNYLTDQAEMNAGMAAGFKFVFETQDKPMAEAQQRMMGPRDLTECRPALLSSDRAAMQARRVYDRLLAREAAGAAPASALEAKPVAMA